MEEMMVRTSERTSFKRCRYQWKWGYIDCLSSTTPNRHLRLGILVHEALAKFYKPGTKRGPNPVRTFTKMVDADVEEHGDMIFKDSDDENKRLDAKTLGIAMLTGYIALYGKDERYEVISPEMPFALDIHDSKGNYVFTYVGTIDAVVRDMVTGKLGLMEHKTGAKLTIPAPLALDEQAGSYWAYAPSFLAAEGYLEEGEELDFILYNFLRKGLPDERPRDADGFCLNQDGTRSKRQPNPLFRREQVFRSDHDRATLMRRSILEAREIRKARAGKLAIYKNPGDHCNWCQFRDMCEVHETGSDWKAMRDAMYTKWDPYEVHDVEVPT